MFINERYDNLLKIIKEKGCVSYDFLAKATYCSQSTIRRDINEMVSRGLVAKIHGGVTTIDSRGDESSIAIRASENLMEKKEIAQKASQYLVDGKSMFFDSSTTVAELIPHLKHFRRSMVITNSLNNALLLSNNTTLDVYVIGGSLQRRTNSLGGVTSNSIIESFNCDIAFISSKGINDDGIVTDASFETQKAKQLMIKNAKTKILLIDHSKFNSTYLLTTFTIKDIDIIITDKKPSQKFINLCSMYNTKLIF